MYRSLTGVALERLCRKFMRKFSCVQFTPPRLHRNVVMLTLTLHYHSIIVYCSITMLVFATLWSVKIFKRCWHWLVSG